MMQENLSKKNQISDHTLEGHQSAVKALDACFGSYATFVTLLAAFLVTQGVCSLKSFFIFLAFLLINLTISQISLRRKNPFRLEITRMFVINSTASYLVYINTDGPLAPFWPVFLMMSLAGGIYLLIWTRHRSWSYLQILFWITLFWFANQIKLDPVFNRERWLIVAGAIMMSTALLIEIMHALTLSLRREESTHIQLIQAAKMKALGEMAGGIAHEINNPLAIIRVLTAQLVEILENIPEKEKTTIQQMGKEIESTVLRISKIISGLRQLSRDDTNDPLSVVSLKDIIEETLALCSEQLLYHQIEIKRPSSSQLDHKIQCRPTQISQVLLNLLNNSRDAIIELSEKWIEIKMNKYKDWIEISLTDSGHGIPLHIREKLFQPFVTSKEIGKGTGLGLSLSKAMIESQHGTLHLDENSPHTRFVIRLPTLPETSKEVPSSNVA